MKIKELWVKSIAAGILIWILTAFYFYSNNGFFSLYFANKTFAWTAFFLIGLSMSLSSIGYLFPVFKKALGYRKYIGLTGFWSFAIHFSLSFVVLRSRFPLFEYFLVRENISSTLAGAAAALILLTMIFASRDSMIKKLGAVLWRRILRLGYLVMALVIVHFGLKIYPRLDKLSLLAIFFAIIVFVLRIILEIRIRKKI